MIDVAGVQYSRGLPWLIWQVTIMYVVEGIG